MSVRTDHVNLLVNVNGNEGLNEMNKLRKSAADIRAEMSELKKGTEEYIQKAKALKEVEGNMATLRKQIGLTALTQKELLAELKRLQMLKNTTTPQTKEFEELQKRIELVNKRLFEVKNGVFGVGATFARIKDEVKQFGMLALSYLGFEFISDQMKQIIRNGAKMSDQLADVRRAAGLTAPEVDILKNSLRDLGTRTSNSALLDIAIVAGKLGVQKNEIAGFTKEVDKLMVALGDELGDADAITTNLGKILNVFDGVVKGDNIGKLGNAIVELANDGVASGPYITDFTQRVAGIAKAAGLSLGSTLGLGAGFEELGLRSESSSTALQKIISDIAKDIPTAAKMAQMPVKEFNELFAFKPQEALIRYAEGLVKNKQGFAEVTASFASAGEEGARIVQTLQAIGQRGDFLREKIDLANTAIQSTTAITDAYRLKNETLGATLDKIGKQLSSMFTSSAFMKGLERMAQGFADLIGVTDNANSALNQFRQQQEKVTRLEKDFIPLIDRYEELEQKANKLGGTTKLSKDEQIELNKAIQTIANGIPYAITQFDEYGKAIAISTANAREYIRLQQLILKEKNRDAITDQKKIVQSLTEEMNMHQRNLQSFEKKLQTEKDITGELVKRGFFDKQEFNKRINYYTEGIDQLKTKIGELRDRISGGKGIIDELTGTNLNNALNNTGVSGSLTTAPELITGGSSDADKKRDRAAKKQFDERAAAYDKFLEDLRRIREEHQQAELTGDALEIAKVHEKYRALYEVAKKYKFDVTELTEEEEEEIEKIKLRYAQRTTNMETNLRLGEFTALKEEYDEKLKLYEDHKKAIEELDNKLFQKEIEAIEKRDDEKRDHQDKVKEQQKKALGDLLDAQYNLMVSYDNLVSVLEQNALDEDASTNAKKKKHFDDQLKAKLISQAEHDRQIELLDKKSDERKREIEIKQLERRKKMSIMQAIMNGAEGITKIWATYAAVPYIAALLTAIEVAAVGTQIAAISQQQVPKAEKGLKIKGKRHRDGGEMINAEEGEVILSRNTVANNQPLVDRLLFNSQNRNGASISTSNVLPVFTSSSSGRSGGFNANSTDPYVNEALNLIAQQQAKTNEYLAAFPTTFKGYIVLKDLQDQQNTLDYITKESGLNQ